MDRIRFSDNERKLLIAISNGEDVESIKNIDINIHSKIAALEYLRAKGLIRCAANEDDIIDVKIESFGIAYLKEYPKLENPPDENTLRELQIDNLEYKKRIRKQEGVIRTWKLLTAISGILGFIGWLLLIAIKFFF